MKMKKEDRLSSGDEMKTGDEIIRMRTTGQGPRVCLFDVFGTVVDWLGSISRRLASDPALERHDRDWRGFTLEWRELYRPSMRKVQDGTLPWTNLDGLHRMSLDTLLDRHGIRIGEQDRRRINLYWHALDPWPDSVRGIERLRRRHIVGTLSNGNVALLTDMARHAGLGWDVILSAELARTYKLDRECYRTNVRLTGYPPHRVIMVAAHGEDLGRAREVGMRTAYVHRPLEYGEPRGRDCDFEPDYDCASFLELADQVG